MSDQTGTSCDNHGFILEQGQRLSRSMIWTLQESFFKRRGIDAWSRGTVPHYITSNPFIARGYGQVVAAWVRDWQRAAEAADAALCPALDPGQPIHLIELGSGCGRFAYHFLKQFFATWPSRSHGPRVRFVMTDFTERNVLYWMDHPKLRRFVEAGCLDFACFNPLTDGELHLRVSGELLTAEDTANPVAFLANYVLDGLPQDAFSIIGGQLHECLATVSSPEAELDLSDPDLIARVNVRYEHRPTDTDYYEDQAWNQVLEAYQDRLDDTVVLFPVGALLALENLSRFGAGRGLFLSADKGYESEESLLRQGEACIAVHGSFSLMVNYHALAEVMRRKGGRALLPCRRHVHLVAAAIVIGSPPGDVSATCSAFDQVMSRVGPDDHFALKKGLEKLYALLSLDELLAYIRLSGYDANIVRGCAPAMVEQLPTATEAHKRDLDQVIQQAWEMYYPIGEERDLASSLGELRLAMSDYAGAFEFFEHALELEGPTSQTLYYLAVCHLRLRQWGVALDVVQRALELEPSSLPARALRLELEALLASQSSRRSDCVSSAGNGELLHPGYAS
jgi:tetratricopeptide (TPR) repeat protein